MYGTLNLRKESTVAIADGKGHLLSKKSKYSDSFNHGTHVYDTSAARWPKVRGCIVELPQRLVMQVFGWKYVSCCFAVQPNPLVNTGAHATMGYKGILTGYLNASTVSIPSVDIAGCKERNFH